MKLPQRIVRAINRFDNAAQDYAFVGSKDPAERPLIRQEYRQAKENLQLAIKEIILEGKE